MKIWIIKDSEPVDFITSSVRPFRYSSLALMLSNNGHEVHLFVSSFDHFKKQQRDYKERKIEGSNLVIHTLSSISYDKHVSFRRLLSHLLTAISFRKTSRLISRPDIILASVPTVELAFAVSKYAKKNSIPLISDVVDLWPDFFKDVLPNWKYLIILPYFIFLNQLLRVTLNASESVTALTDSYLNWAIHKSNRTVHLHNLVVPLGHPTVDLANTTPLNESSSFDVLFVGSMTRQFDMDTVFEAANQLLFEDVRFIMVGQGDKDLEWVKKTESLSNVIWRGWLDGQDLHNEFLSADIGLLPYINAPHFQKNITNKFSEYLAYGLPVFLSIEGEMANTISNMSCGHIYHNSNDLVQKVLYLKRKPEILKSFSNNAIQLHFDSFRIDDLNAKFVEHIENTHKNYLRK